MPSADERSLGLFTDTFGGDPTGVARSPGRVNLIGDHTDYNDGFVLPMAIDRDTVITFRQRADHEVHVVSEGLGSVHLDLSDLAHGEPTWAEYVRGMAWAMESIGPGWEAAIATDIPIGAGLSSSASLEIAVGLIIDLLGSEDRSRTDLARLGQRAENDWVGMACGIMDQLSVAEAHAGHAMLLDCGDLSLDQIPMPDDLVIMVLDTATRRELTDSAYNERRATCERAARRLGVPSLRSVTVDELPEALEILDDTAARRVRHVVTENARVLATADALRADDPVAAGRTMTESHRSLRDDFESSTPELDVMVEVALSIAGCHGARVTGAGFGGSAVAAVDRDRVGEFSDVVIERYRDATGLQPEVLACVPSAGASVVQR